MSDLRPEWGSLGMRLLSKTATYEDNIYHFTLNFHWGRGSFTLHAGTGYSCIYEACVSPTLDRRSLVASALNSDVRIATYATPLYAAIKH